MLLMREVQRQMEATSEMKPEQSTRQMETLAFASWTATSSLQCLLQIPLSNLPLVQRLEVRTFFGFEMRAVNQLNAFLRKICVANCSLAILVGCLKQGGKLGVVFWFPTFVLLCHCPPKQSDNIPIV